MRSQRRAVLGMMLALVLTAAGSAHATDHDLYEWELVTREAAFAPRDGAGPLVFQKRMWLLGGWMPKDQIHFPKVTNNEVWSSTDGKTWKLVRANTFDDGVYDPTTMWEGRHSAGVAVFKGKMWIIGGDVSQGYHQVDIWNSKDGVTWKRALATPPWPTRVLHYVAAFAGKLWVMGGQAFPNIPVLLGDVPTVYNDVWNSSDGIHWKKVRARGPRWYPRGVISYASPSVVFRDRLWIVGGGRYAIPRKYYRDVWSSADGITWTRHLRAPWAGRQYHTVAVYDRKLWVMAGAVKRNDLGCDRGPRCHNTNDVWYSEDGDTWHQVPGTPWKITHAGAAWTFEHALYFQPGMSNEIWKLSRLDR